jgi:hypothetical protein
MEVALQQLVLHKQGLRILAVDSALVVGLHTGQVEAVLAPR